MFDNLKGYNFLNEVYKDLDLPHTAEGKLKQVIVRLTHNGVTSDYTFQVSPTTDTAIVELNLDRGGLKK